MLERSMSSFWCSAISLAITDAAVARLDSGMKYNIKTMYLDKKRAKIPGIPTHLQKEKYVESLQTDLSLHSLCFDEEMVCVNPILRTDQALREYCFKIKPNLFKQLRGFRVLMGQDSAFRNTKPVYTGKVDENGNKMPGLNDDMVISLIMASYWSKEITSRPQGYNVDPVQIYAR